MTDIRHLADKTRWFLRSLLPDFWIMNYPYSESWDKALNRLLDVYDFSEIGVYTAKLGDTKVWISNVPYAAFTPQIRGLMEDVRPSRITIARALEKLINSGFSLRGNFDSVGVKDE